MAPVKHPYFTSFTSLGTLPNLCALSVIQVAMSDHKKKVIFFFPQTRKVVGCGHNLVVFVRAPRLACSSGSLQQVHFYVRAAAFSVLLLLAHLIYTQYHKEVEV